MNQVIPTKYGIRDGGAFFSCNMRKSSDGGVMAGYSVSNLAHYSASSATERLGVMRRFVQREYESNITIWGLNPNSSGGIWAMPYYSNRPRQATDLGAAPGDNWSVTGEDIGASLAFEVCNDNEIVYSGRKYVGKTITTTLNGAITDTSTSVTLTSLTSFPSTGQAVILNAFNLEAIEYTGINTTTSQLTGVTRGKYYTGAKSWSTGAEVVGFRNKWLTWTSALGYSVKSPSVKWEDYIFIGRGNKVGGWKEDSGSDFNEALLTLPSNYEIVDMTTILTGAGTMVLIGANRENSGDIFVWNGVDTTWLRTIPCGENIKKLYQQYVGLKSGLYLTDGYSLRLLGEMPDDKKNPRQSNFNVKDITSKGEQVLCLAEGDSINGGQRNRSGLWIFDTQDKDWMYVPAYGGNFYDITMGSIFVSSEWKIIFSTDYKTGSIDRLDTSLNSKSNFYQILYNPPNAQVLRLQEIKLNIEPSITDYWQEIYDSNNMDIDILVRYYDFSRPLYQYTQVNATCPDASTVLVSKSLGLPRVGDRLEFAQNGSNNNIAGCVRNITAVSEGASSYTLTLDSPLPETPLNNSQMIILNPLKKIKTISLTDYKIDEQALKFRVDGSPQFKKLLLEIEIRDRGNYSYTIPFGLNAVELRFGV